MQAPEWMKLGTNHPYYSYSVEWETLTSHSYFACHIFVPLPFPHYLLQAREWMKIGTTTPNNFPVVKVWDETLAHLTAPLSIIHVSPNSTPTTFK